MGRGEAQHGRQDRGDVCCTNNWRAMNVLHSLRHGRSLLIHGFVVDEHGKKTFHFETYLTNDAGEAVARVSKEIYIRRK